MIDPQSENKLVHSAAAGLQIHSNVAFIPAERCRIYLTTSDLCKSMLDETGLANVSVKVSRCFVWGCSLYSVSAMESVFPFIQITFSQEIPLHRLRSAARGAKERLMHSARVCVVYFTSIYLSFILLYSLFNFLTISF